MSLGKFSGNPLTEWLSADGAADRDMRLIDDFSFTDPAGRLWRAPKQSVIDGASIPRALWSTVGSPYTDDYRRASVVHDVAVSTPGVVRKEADLMFYQACLAGGCPVSQARILYAGVQLGGWASTVFPKTSMTREKLLFRLSSEPDGLDEQFLKAKLDAISIDLRTLPVGAPITEVDAIIARHIPH
jgi:hypothetical protein